MPFLCLMKFKSTVMGNIYDPQSRGGKELSKFTHQMNQFPLRLSQGQDRLELFLRECDVPCSTVSFSEIAFKNEMTYLIKMENEIKFADIFESSVKRFH